MAVGENDDDTETDNRPGSPPSVCARTPSAPRQASGATDEGQAKRMAFRPGVA
jgi:hypothetical protein